MSQKINSLTTWFKKHYEFILKKHLERQNAILIRKVIALANGKFKVNYDEIIKFAMDKGTYNLGINGNLIKNNKDMDIYISLYIDQYLDLSILQWKHMFPENKLTYPITAGLDYYRIVHKLRNNCKRLAELS